MKKIFLNYILETEKLDKKGGRNAILENQELEELYDKIIDLEDEILKKFGLPKLFYYRDIIMNLKSEFDIESIESQFKYEAEEYLRSTPLNVKELLENAKINNLKTYEVLPEIGIEDTLYTMFYFEELYKKEKISTTDFLNYVSKFDSETSEQIGDLRFAQSKNKKYLETLKILELKKIPYLTELINYKPEYPY